MLKENDWEELAKLNETLLWLDEEAEDERRDDVLERALLNAED